MTLQQAQEVLTHFAVEREAAHESNMDWQPSRESRKEIHEAKSVIDEHCFTTNSTRVEALGEETVLAMWSYDE